MIDAPRPSVADVQRLVAAQLSVPSRVGHVILLVASLVVATAVASLWATEPSLPVRTHVAFAFIVSAAAAWAVFAAWVLARRRVLFGADRVLAAKMGMTFSALAAAGMAALGYWGGLGRGAYSGALVQILLCAVAVVLLIRARRHVTALSRRRQELENRIKSEAGRRLPAGSA
jgi:hypothetical protein